jgi:hypothetical protein
LVMSLIFNKFKSGDHVPLDGSISVHIQRFRIRLVRN